MKLIFDLDGTLLDSKLRLYTLFADLVPESALSFEGYWARKMSGVSNVEILSREFGCADGRIKEFVGSWMERIESPCLLSLDTLLPCVRQTLGVLHETSDLYICTARQDPVAMEGQLESLGIKGFFREFLVTKQARSKASLISASVSVNCRDWLVGDTGADITAARELGIKSCAVLTGFLNEDTLRAYSPDLLIASVRDFWPFDEDWRSMPRDQLGKRCDDE